MLNTLFKPVLLGKLARFSSVQKSVAARYYRLGLITKFDQTPAGFPRFSMNTVLLVQKIRRMEKEGWSMKMIKRKIAKLHGK